MRAPNPVFLPRLLTMLCLLFLTVALNDSTVYSQTVPVKPGTATDTVIASVIEDEVPVAHPPGKGIHWILLVDTSAHASAPQIPVAFERTTAALWQTGRIRPGDWVSVVPYQRDIDAVHVASHWRLPVVRYSDVQSALPPQTQRPGNGHDPDRAVRDTLNRLQQSGSDKNGAVLLLMARTDFAQKPTGEPGAPIVEATDPELVRLLKAAKMRPVSFPVYLGDTKIQIRRYIPDPLQGTDRAPVPWPRWLVPLLWSGAAIVLIGVLLWVFRKRLFPGPHHPSLEIGRPGTAAEITRGFPDANRILLYGTGQGRVDGVGDKPSLVSLSHRDLPIAASGPLLEVDARDRNHVILKPGICTTSIKELAYDEEKQVTLTPDPSTGGMAVTYRIKVVRKRRD